MKLGVYRRPDIESDSDVYTRLALYDFETGEWEETSEGRIVSKASADPTPEELKVRFEADPNARTTIVRTPERMETDGLHVEIGDPTMTVEEGHAERESQGGPLPTQTEAQAQKDQGLIVVPDDAEISDEDREFYAADGREIIRESDWEFDFAAEFDFDFGPRDPV